MVTQEVIISASRLNKTFIGENKRPKPVLRDVTLTAHAGELSPFWGNPARASPRCCACWPG